MMTRLPGEVPEYREAVEKKALERNRKRGALLQQEEDEREEQLFAEVV